MGHTFDTKGTAVLNSGNGTTPLTWSHTCAAGATVLVVNIITQGATERTGTPTYNGVSMTVVPGGAQKAASGPEAISEAWYLLAPPTDSAYTVSVPNQSLKLRGVSSSYIAASGTSTFDTSNVGNNTSTNPSVSVTTSNAGCVIVGGVANGAQTWAPSARSGTLLYDFDDGAWGDGTQYFLQTNAGTQAMSWTFATSEDWGEVVVAFYDGAPGGGPTWVPKTLVF